LRDLAGINKPPSVKCLGNPCVCVVQKTDKINGLSEINGWFVVSAKMQCRKMNYEFPIYKMKNGIARINITINRHLILKYCY